MKKTCENCQPFEKRMLEALTERDLALLELAKAKEEINALKLNASQVAVDLPLPMRADVPIRYVVADEMNDVLKKALGGSHETVRALLLKAKNMLK